METLMKRLILSASLILSCTSTVQAKEKEVEIFDYANGAMILGISGAAAESLYRRLDVEETELTPWTNVGKRQLGKDGKILLQCMKYTNGTLGCILVTKPLN